MQNKKDKTKKRIATRWWMIILYIVVLPAIVIPIAYISTYNSNAPVPFDIENAEITDHNNISDFTYTLTVKNYRYQRVDNVTSTTDESGKGPTDFTDTVNVSSRIQFNETFTNIKENMYNVKVSYGLYDHWTSFKKEKLNVAYSDDCFVKGENEYTRRTNQSIVFDLEKPSLPFVTVDYPTLFIKIDYQIDILGTLVDKSVILKYEHTEFLNENVEYVQ